MEAGAAENSQDVSPGWNEGTRAYACRNAIRGRPQRVGARSFEHFDTITVSMPDAPKLDEIVVAARISGR